MTNELDKQKVSGYMEGMKVHYDEMYVTSNKELLEIGYLAKVEFAQLVIDEIKDGTFNSNRVADPETFIATLRESDLYIKDIYTKGSCYHFYKVLKSLFPQSEPYKVGFDGHDMHIITKIDDKYYDINGEIYPSVYEDCNPLSPTDHKKFEKYSFGGMHAMHDYEEMDAKILGLKEQLKQVKDSLIKIVDNIAETGEDARSMHMEADYALSILSQGTEDKYETT